MNLLLTFILILTSVGAAYGQKDYQGTLKKANSGDAEAQSRIAFMHLMVADGADWLYDDVPKASKEQNRALSVRWYSLAANQGNSQGQFVLGIYYSSGTGVKQDKVEAYKWFKLAQPGKKGHISHEKTIHKFLAELEVELTASQLVEAKKRIQSFRPKGK